MATEQSRHLSVQYPDEVIEKILKRGYCRRTTRTALRSTRGARLLFGSRVRQMHELYGLRDDVLLTCDRLACARLALWIVDSVLLRPLDSLVILNGNEASPVRRILLQVPGDASDSPLCLSARSFEWQRQEHIGDYRSRATQIEVHLSQAQAEQQRFHRSLVLLGTRDGLASVACALLHVASGSEEGIILFGPGDHQLPSTDQSCYFGIACG